MPKRAAAPVIGVEDDALTADPLLELPLPLPEAPLPLPELPPSPLPLPDAAVGAEPGATESVPLPLGEPVAVARPVEPAVPVATMMPVVPDEPAVRMIGAVAEPVDDTLLVFEADAEDEEEDMEEHEVELSIVTLALLHTLANALKAAAALLLQFLQMYSSTAVALLPLQTAWSAAG
ncbi:hypothetical protein LTR74_018852, partial [Friedmanniomyces endolithicus]